MSESSTKSATEITAKFKTTTDVIAALEKVMAVVIEHDDDTTLMFAAMMALRREAQQHADTKRQVNRMQREIVSLEAAIQYLRVAKQALSRTLESTLVSWFVRGDEHEQQALLDNSTYVDAYGILQCYKDHIPT